MPARTLEQALDFVCTDIRPDVLVWLGDNSNHQFWEVDLEEHHEFTEKVAHIIDSKLKNCEGLDTVVVPIIGNHELKPMDEHDFSKKDYPMIHNVLDRMADYFERWLTKEELDHFREHGYYTKMIKKNLRILCLFTATDLMTNYTLWNQEFDPGNQLAWMADELHKAWLAGESVQVLHHQPIGTGINKTQNDAYEFLFRKYSEIIKALLAGHTHYDESYFVWDKPQKNVTVPVLIAPSMTTFDNTDPSMRLFKMNAGSHDIVDYDQYSIDVKAANREYENMKANGYQYPEQHQVLKWSIAYSMKDYYKIQDTGKNGIITKEAWTEYANRRINEHPGTLKAYHEAHYQQRRHDPEPDHLQVLKYKCSAWTNNDAVYDCFGKEGVSNLVGFYASGNQWLNPIFGTKIEFTKSD